jgi:sugar lactone lactonase YvrE
MPERQAEGRVADRQGEVEGPEDVIFDRDDNLYCPNRHGDIVRFLAPDYTNLGSVRPHRRPSARACLRRTRQSQCLHRRHGPLPGVARSHGSQTDRRDQPHLLSVIDDSRLKLADDLDIAPDGRIFFSEATIRYDMHDWATDALESRGNGRLICYDPRDGSTRTILRNLQFPNGVCMAGDGQSFFFAETWGCRINRYWFDGPKKGTSETVIANLPGYPDNINKASDGSFWVALVGMRSPALDLALRMPSLRKRMAKRVARDEWLFPNINTGCVLKFTASGEIVESLWDLGGKNHPMVTSMREHKGYLYLGGLYNDRIGRLKLPDADPNWTSQSFYWGGPNEHAGSKVRGVVDGFMGGRGEHSITVPVMDGALKPNDYLERSRGIATIPRPTISLPSGGDVFLTSGVEVLRRGADGKFEPHARYRRRRHIPRRIAGRQPWPSVSRVDGFQIAGGRHDGKTLLDPAGPALPSSARPPQRLSMTTRWSSAAAQRTFRHSEWSRDLLARAIRFGDGSGISQRQYAAPKGKSRLSFRRLRGRRRYHPGLGGLEAPVVSMDLSGWKDEYSSRRPACLSGP